MWGFEKEKLLLPLLPFCLQHAWIKVAMWAQFTVDWAEMAPDAWVLPVPALVARSWLHGRSWLRMAPVAWPHQDGAVGCLPTTQKKNKSMRAVFFLLKYVIREALPTSLAGLVTCSFSEPSGIGCARHSRSFEQLLGCFIFSRSCLRGFSHPPLNTSLF